MALSSIKMVTVSDEERYSVKTLDAANSYRHEKFDRKKALILRYIMEISNFFRVILLYKSNLTLKY